MQSVLGQIIGQAAAFVHQFGIDVHVCISVFGFACRQSVVYFDDSRSDSFEISFPPFFVYGINRLQDDFGIGQNFADLGDYIENIFNDRVGFVPSAQIVYADQQHHQTRFQIKDRFVHAALQTYSQIACNTSVDGVQAGVVFIQIAKIGYRVADENDAALRLVCVFARKLRDLKIVIDVFARPETFKSRAAHYDDKHDQYDHGYGKRQSIGKSFVSFHA